MCVTPVQLLQSIHFCGEDATKLGKDSENSPKICSFFCIIQEKQDNECGVDALYCELTWIFPPKTTKEMGKSSCENSKHHSTSSMQATEDSKNDERELLHEPNGVNGLLLGSQRSSMESSPSGRISNSFLAKIPQPSSIRL